MSDLPEVAGYCPMGCGPTLVLAGQEWAGEGNVTCSAKGCPDPGRIHTILQDPETEHVVVLEAERFHLQHPLRERAHGELFDCEVHRRLQALDAPPRPPGRYRVIIRATDGLAFEPIEVAPA